MGVPMAGRLLDAGIAVTAWNRSPDKLAPLLARGARAAATPADAAAAADVLVTMLRDGPAVDSVLFAGGAAAALRPGGMVVDMSSIAPPFARDHAARASVLGLAYADAPVSGGTRGATEGTLAIMVGCAPGDFARLAPLFAPLGRATRVGGPGAGQVAKLVNQTLVAIGIAGVAEGLLLARAAGADAGAVRDAIRGGFAESRVLAEHGGRMLERRFAAGGTVDNQIKDLDAALALAAESGAVLPVLARVRGLFAALRDAGDGGLDHSALLLQLERDSRRPD
jgi:2-hydroxy-3-oxopropionate reductase